MDTTKYPWPVCPYGLIPTMSDYTTDLGAFGCTVTQEYTSGTELEVEVASGFVRIDIDGDTVFHRHRSDMRDLPDHLAEIDGGA
jgi:hypothetical protein